MSQPKDYPTSHSSSPQLPQTRTPPWTRSSQSLCLPSVTQDANIRTGLVTTAPSSATRSSKRTACTKPTSPPHRRQYAAFYRSRRLVQQRLREMQDAWTARKFGEIQGYADRDKWKNSFFVSKAVCVPSSKATSPLLSTDRNTLLTEKTQLLRRWAEHFRGVLNHPSIISDSAFARLPQVQTNVDLELPPSLSETIRALQQLSSGKAPGSDALRAISAVAANSWII
nr:unnamed protein product [Spirometra erinaceieuropaei]